MSKPGTKEAALREMREDDLSIPAILRRTEDPRKKKKAEPKKNGDAGVTLAPPLAVQKAIAKELADDPPAATKPEAAKPKAQQPKETVMRAATKTKKAAAPAAKRAKPTGERRKIAKHPAQKRAGVPAQAVADMMARKGGASMDELTAKFKIDAHPMRAKVFYVRHTLGYKVEHKDGRYFATAPKAKK